MLDNIRWSYTKAAATFNTDDTVSTVNAVDIVDIIDIADIVNNLDIFDIVDIVDIVACMRVRDFATTIVFWGFLLGFFSQNLRRPLFTIFCWQALINYGHQKLGNH